MSTTEVLIIVLLSVAATALVTAYLTLVIVNYVEKRIIRRYLGEDDEYDGDESESSDGNGKSNREREDRKRNKEGFLRYRCKRDKNSWLLSLSPSEPDRKTSKDKEVPKT